MPFKRGKLYRVRFRDLPGYGPFPETCTRVGSVTTARAMERLIVNIAERGLVDPSWKALLDALRAGKQGARPRLTLPELLAAENEHRLGDLRRLLREPTLNEAVEQYLETDPPYDTRNGLRILGLMAERQFGAECRFSVLRSGKNITLLCARAEREGGRPSKALPDGRPMARNSARRTIMLSASKLLRFHLGAAARDEVFADVVFPKVRDVRDVWLAPEELERLLRACELWFRPFVMMAVATGADRSPLLRLRVRDVQISELEGGRLAGVAYLRDTKTDARPRSVSLIEPVCEELRPLVQMKRPDDPVFNAPPVEAATGLRLRKPPRGSRTGLTETQVRYYFERAREEASLPHVRFKDLRRTWAVSADNAGLSLGEMKAGLGHGLEETTVRYTNRQVTLDMEAAERVAREMGLIERAG